MSAAFNDEPTVADSLGRAGWVRWFAENLKNCEPPYVFGLHGDWGSGKTSFLHQMYGFFTGYSPAGKKLVPQITNTWGTHWKSSERHIVVIFEAWRYQHEATPVVALLHEIRAQWSWYNKTFKWLGKIGEVATRGALLVFDEATRKIDNDTSIKVKPSSSGIQALGERWEADHFENTLPTQKLREFLSEAIKVLSGDSRIIILIDDLDRCQPEAAYKLLEGIKIYLNLPNCVFVLAMDQQQIQRAVATCMPGGRSGNDPDADATQLHQAAEYMEKICQDIWQLPLMPTTAHELFLRGCLEGHTAGHAEVFEQVFQVLRNNPYLPANARKLKGYANTLRRFVEHCETFAEWVPDKHARMLVIMAALYQFHTPLYRRLEGNQRFYTEILGWLDQGRASDGIFKHIKIIRSGESVSGTAFVAFADPAVGNLLRIGTLIEQQGVITEDEVRHYLLPYARN